MPCTIFRLCLTVVTVWCNALLLGCRADWDLPEPERTGIEPRLGVYTFNQPGCFSVRERAGRKVVIFASDCFRFDEMSITEGAFAHAHGTIGGTNCPTDSNAISGVFRSATRAEGTIKYAFDCRVTDEASFIAELQR